MSGRPLPMAEVREPTQRARRHTVMALVVGGYLLAAVVVIVGWRHRWLALHLLGLGAATNAVMVWSRHFAQALLHARIGAENAATARLVALNIGVIGVLAGVMAPAPAVAAVAACLVVAVVAWHVADLVGMARRYRLPGPLRGVVWFYVAAGTALAAGAGIGAVLASGRLQDDSSTEQRLHLAHAQLNLFGWIGLAVLGTEVVLWPAVLRTRMLERAPRLAWWTLGLCGLGLVVTAGALLGGSRSASAVGAGCYAAGVVVALLPMVATLPGRPSRSAAAWWLGASVAWLLVGAVVDTARLAVGGDADSVLHPLVPLLGLGLVAQALIGALTFLLPVTIGRGPAGNRRLAATLERGSRTRLVTANCGLVLVLVPAGQAGHVVGWALTLVGLASFLPLLALAMSRLGAAVPGR